MSTARLFKEIGEEDGLGDQREEEIRLTMQASIKITGDDGMKGPGDSSFATPTRWRPRGEISASAHRFW